MEIILKVLGNKKLKNVVITTLGITLFLVVTGFDFAYAVQDGDWDSFGRRFWSYVMIFAKWGCLIMCAITILRNVENQDTKGLASIVIRFLILYALIILLPKFFDAVNGIFQ